MQRRKLSVFFLFLALCVTTSAAAVPIRSTLSGKLSNALAQAGVSNVQDDNSVGSLQNDNSADSLTDQSAQVAVRSAINYSGDAVATNSLTADGYPSDGQCGLRVDMPHVSYTTSAQIHTRIESFCTVLPLASNTVSGKTYRSRWYGWQRQATLDPFTIYAPSSRVQQHRETVAANCEPGTWYRYRTEGFGTITIPGRSFSAAAYEQQDPDNEIQCKG
jgi:hypothetical protein